LICEDSVDSKDRTSQNTIEVYIESETFIDISFIHMFAYEQKHISIMKEYDGNHMDTSDHRYEDYVDKEEVVIGGGGEYQPVTSTSRRDINTVQLRVVPSSPLFNVNNDYNSNCNNNIRAKSKQNIVDLNDMMMISASHLKSPINHRYVLTDDEVELSLRELDDTVASLDGTSTQQQQKHRRHRRTNTASSSTPSNGGTTGISSTIIDESSSLGSSVYTERSHAVLMHRHLIDNMETISYNRSHHASQYRSNSSRKKKRSTGNTGGKSISSRVSTNSRRSKLSTAQESYTTYRSTNSNRPPRGPSLERVIFQTLLHAARSDGAEVHFIRKTEDQDIDGNNDDEEDISTESILKDLIQADAILSVEVGDDQKNAMNNNYNKDDSKDVVSSGNTTRSITNENDTNPCLLLPPIATEEEPELLSTSTTQQQSQKNQCMPQQLDDQEWEPDFDAITFPPCGGNTTYQESTVTDPISAAVTQNLPTLNTMTTTTITPSTGTSQTNQPHSSNDDSPESDIFDHIHDSFDDGISFFHDRRVAVDHPFQTKDISSQGPIIGPTVKLYIDKNSNMKPYYDVDNDKTVVCPTSSWGGFDTSKRPTTDNDDDDDDNYNNPCYDPFFSSIAKTTANEKRHSPKSDIFTIPTNPTSDESLFFPTVFQDKPSTTTTTSQTVHYNDDEDDHNQRQQKQRNDKDQWMIFDINPFATRKGEQTSVSSSLVQRQQQQQLVSDPPNFFSDRKNNNSNNHRYDVCSHSIKSQDNVSVSSPSSVVQFVQIVDRCPSNTSSFTENNNNPPFDTKCSI
jgi:hypothetical protein